MCRIYAECSSFCSLSLSLAFKYLYEKKHPKHIALFSSSSAQLTCTDASSSHDVRVIPDSHSLTVLRPFIALQELVLPLYFTESLNQHCCKLLRGTLVNKNKMLTLLLLNNATIIIKKELKLQYSKSWH